MTDNHHVRSQANSYSIKKTKLNVVNINKWLKSIKMIEVKQQDPNYGK